MALVLYDLETTGLSRHFDQIVQFGAVRLDSSLEIVEHYETSCRLQPHIVPAPSALHVTGTSYLDLISPSRRSHFSMIVDIHERFTRWSPSVFIGYNSIKFDEEFLRHAFYQCLLEPYVTSRGNARGDVLRLARAVSKLRPDVLPPAFDADGERSMKLHDVAMACGFRSEGAHEAMADIEAMRWIVKIIYDGAPEVWSRFMQFSTKAAAQDFIREEDAFVSFEADRAGQGFRLLTAFGQHPTQNARRYCLDLSVSLDGLRGASDEQLIEWFKDRDGPLRRVKTNGSPLLFPLYEALDTTFPGLVEEDVLRLARSIRTDEELTARLNAAAFATEPIFEASAHVEQQLYDRFIPDAEKLIMQQFHAAPWQERPSIVQKFSDARLRRLGQRAIYFEEPQLISNEVRAALDAAVRERWTGNASMPWMTASRAIAELQAMPPGISRSGQSEYEGILLQIASSTL